MGVSIEIDDEQAARLRELTHEEDLAKVISRALEHWLLCSGAGEPAETPEVQAPVTDSSARESAYAALLGICGIAEGMGDGGADLHDHYIYDREMP